MTDPVLQSFCERCGTRYTFSETEATPPEENKGVLSRFGRRTPVLGEVETPGRATMPASSEQFAGIFHFCLDCRQYICTECWNTEAGGCLSCRPRKQAGGEASGAGATSGSFAASQEPAAWPAGDVAGASASAARKAAVTRQGDASDVSSVELDEWGRPRPKRPASESVEEAPERSLFGSQGGEVDPWRGVVFSADEASAGPSGPPPPKDLSSALAARAAASTWRDLDRKSDPIGAKPASAIPPSPTKRGDEVSDQPVREAVSQPGAEDEYPSASDRIEGSDAHVSIDAADWARASAIVVARSHLAEPEPVVEPAPHRARA